MPRRWLNCMTRSGMNIYLDVFTTFAKIGAFTIGGGYAMLPLIEEEVVNKKKWIDGKDFLDLVAIAQSAPGVFAVNISIFIGYRLRKTKGAIVATLGSILPSFLIILLIALFFQNFKDNQAIERIFRGIRPAVVALIAAPTFRLAKSANLTRYNVWIPIVSALLIWQLGVSPIYIIIAAGMGGYIYGRFYAGQDEEGHVKTPEEKEREKALARAKKEARQKEKEYKKLQERLERSRKEQEEAKRKAEEAKRKEAEALQMIPQAREEAQKAHQEAERRKEEDRKIKAEQLGLFDVIDPRKVSEDNDPNNDYDDEDEDL